MDWTGDGFSSSFRSLATALRTSGFFLETLRSDWSTFDARRYAALLLLDPEEPVSPREAAKLRRDVRSRGLGLVVAADWFSPAVMSSFDYRDDAGKRHAPLACLAPCCLPDHCALGLSPSPGLPDGTRGGKWLSLLAL
jgi:membrane-bound transcription factor site-1 protease